MDANRKMRLSPFPIEQRGQILGFDCRETDEERLRSPLPRDVRDVLLLRPEIESPLSVDPHIWPTYFLYHPEVWDLLGRQGARLVDVDPDCSGGLWLSLARMKRRLSEHAMPGVLLAVELFAHTVAEFRSSLIYSRPDPPTLPAGSLLLGYDVADAGFWSGLSNCGYSKEEASALRPEWAKRMNDQGLLASLDDALAFRQISDGRVPEHAPFWVYGLHQVT